MGLEIKKRLLFAGIDPGRKGAIALIDDEGGVVALCDLARARDAKDLLDAYRDQIALAGIEAIRSRGEADRHKHHNIAKLLQDAGKWKGVCSAFEIRLVEVFPQTWQRMLTGCPGLNAKQRAVWFVQHVYPDWAERCLGPEGGLRQDRFDALCIAEHVRTGFLRGQFNHE